MPKDIAKTTTHSQQAELDALTGKSAGVSQLADVLARCASLQEQLDSTTRQYEESLASNESLQTQLADEVAAHAKTQAALDAATK